MRPEGNKGHQKSLEGWGSVQRTSLLKFFGLGWFDYNLRLMHMSYKPLAFTTCFLALEFLLLAAKYWSWTMGSIMDGCVLLTSHDDVIKWKPFPCYWPFVRVIHRSQWIPVQRPVTRSFNVFFDLRLNKRLSKQWWGWLPPFALISMPCYNRAIPISKWGPKGIRDTRNL